MSEASKPASMSWWGVVKQAASDWMEDKATKLAAALAFYTMLSIAPLLIILIKIVGAVFGDKAARGQIEGYISETVGSAGAQTVQEIIKNAGEDNSGLMATAISIVVLLFSASGVFGELQDSLNTIWEVKPRSDRGILGTIKDRFFSFSLVLGVAFLLMVSLVASTILSGIADRLGGGETFIWKSIHFLISITVITGLFALILRYLPDVRTPWRAVLVGAAATAVLFTLGKFALGWYLGRESTTSVWGAFGSLVALLLWVYYSAQILFFGAEFTQAYAHAMGYKMRPLPKAVRITQEDRAQQGIASPERVAAKVRQSPVRPITASRTVALPTARTSYVRNGKKTYAVAGAGLIVGAAAGVLAALNLKTDPTRVTRKHTASVKLDQRIHAIEAKIGRVSRLKGYLNSLDVSDRIDHVERQLRHATTTLRAKQTGRPRWMVRLRELVAGG